MKSLAESGILEILRAVFSYEISIGAGSLESVSGEEKIRGNITSPTARQLFTVNQTLLEEIFEKGELHQRLHNEGAVGADHDCRGFLAEMLRLDHKKGIIHNLLWQAITTEHLRVAGNNAHIRDGWVLASADGEWEEPLPLPDGGATSGFISHVKSIVSGSNVKVETGSLTPVATGEEPIGVLADERVKGLHAFVRDVTLTSRSELLAVTLGKPDMSEDVLPRLIVHLSELVNTAHSLFWCAVRDAVPQARDLPTIGVREGWQIVKTTPPNPAHGLSIMVGVVPIVLQTHFGSPN